MEAFKQKNLLIFFYGFILFEPLFLYSNKIFAKELNKNTNLIVIVKSFNELDLKALEKTENFSDDNYFYREKLIRDLRLNGDKLFNFLAFEENVLEEKFSVEIDSDIQYRENDLFTAEGNAIIYLSNASLKGDLITYDTQNKLLTVTGNVIFKKGKQYFEASKVFYDLKKDTGYIENVYGLLDSETFTNDFNLQLNETKREDINPSIKNEISQLELANTATIGLVNEFEYEDSLNIKKAEINIPEITRWRYKADKLTYDSKYLRSKKIFFTNDIYNSPQFIFQSNNFSADIKDDKLRLISRNSWIILDNNLRVPIGRRALFDKDPLTKWGLGADFKDKDGYYLFRGTNPKKIFKDFSIKIQPYFLLQRTIEGNTSAFTANNSSIFSDKVESDIQFSDYFALDIGLNGKQNKWNVNSNIQLNSLNTERLSESLRSKLTFTRQINLNEKNKDEKNEQKDLSLNNFIGFQDSNNKLTRSEEDIDNNLSKLYSQKREDAYNNFLDLKIYNIFRETVVKDFATEEIYFASGFNVANKKSWFENNKNTDLSLIYDFGHFKSKSRTANEFKELFRNTFVAQYNYKFPLWKKKIIEKTIDETYVFSPVVIDQSIDWSTGLQSGLFFYSDGSSQVAAKFNTGPTFTLGSFKKKFFDYTYFSANFNYVIKEGDSPLSFDNINEDPRINFNYEQQIYGPLMLSLQSSLNLESGDFSDPYYGLDIKRRAYAIGAFYNSSDETLGIRFNIFNFNYEGLGPKF